MRINHHAAAIEQDTVQKGFETLEHYMASQVPVRVTEYVDKADGVSSAISGDARYVGLDVLERFLARKIQ